jgi:pyruvate dehydrogenase E2 component (dihydrolipoamide acetyltransferase)/2-oxoisovalerate dehydrogenase E2 component (dihydrolipoyl transacylase)
MSQSKREIPHYSLIDECDVTELVRLRASLKESCDQAGLKLTYLAFVVRAAVAALKEFPILNASLTKDGSEIVFHDRYDIGFAAATPQGLIVPVIHGADRLDLFGVAREIERLTNAARLGKLTPEEVRGGTFTVTSIGNIGGLISTPIIHAPEVAIMGVGRIVRRPIYDEHGDLRPADLVYLSFSFDHRVIDGDVGAHFANAVMQRLSNPARLLVPAAL